MEALDSYIVFAEVVDRDSFTAAADALNVSKSTVSNHISRLEETLGVRLLNRTTRKMSLTEEGAAVYERCREIVGQLEAIRSELEHFSEEPRGRLRVNAPMTFGLMHLSPLVAEFGHRYPHVELDLQLDDRVVDLIEGGFDLGIRITRKLAKFSMKGRRLARSRRVVCATPKYFDEHGRPRTPRDLETHACINYTYLSTGDVWTFDSPHGEHRVRVDGPVESNSSFVIRDAVLGHRGIAQFPAFAVAQELADGRLEVVLEDWTMPSLNIFALYPQTHQVPRKVRVFIDFLVEQFSSVQW